MLSLVTVIISGCSKSKKESVICGDGRADQPRPLMMAGISYSNPQWSPDGQLIAFNHMPLDKLITGGCLLPHYSVKQDSAGLYLINRDGTGLKRITTKQYPFMQWSPDGKWLALTDEGNVKLLPFNGTTFDTSAQVKLTGNNYYSNIQWAPTSDSLFMLGTTSATSADQKIFRIAPDGTGLTVVYQGYTFFSITTDRIYFTDVKDIFSVKKDGSDKQQHTSGNHMKAFLLNHKDSLFYQIPYMGLWAGKPGGDFTEIAPQVQTFDVSATGEIVFCKFNINAPHTDKQNGTIWIMNADGSDQRQITYNHIQ